MRREHDKALDTTGLRVGALQMREGILCSTDEGGRLYLRAPRKADVRLAQRVVASMAGAGDSVAAQLVADLTGVREKK